MEWVTPVAAVVVCVVLPYIVNLCKKASWPTNAKRWIAIVVSAVVGICAGIIAGAPTPETLATWVFGVIGGVQIAYSAFKSIGVTSTWLDALEGIGVKDGSLE